mgnify:CR=1 FL=1
MQRSLLELDSLLHRGVEILVLGEPLLAIDIFNDYLAELEERFQNEGKKETKEDIKTKDNDNKDKESSSKKSKHIPIDVLTRRFKVLMLLAECRRGMEQDELALQNLIECNALARGPLAEFPDFLVQSTMEIARIYVFRKEPAAAKQYVSEATRIAKSSKEPYLVSLAGFATGLLFSCVGRHSEAHSIFSGAAARLDGLNDPEHILLKADILLHMGHEQNIRENVEEAAKTYADTVRFLLECSRNSIAQSCARDALRFLMLANRHADLLPRDEANVQLMSSLAVTTGALLDSIGYWDKAWPCFIRALELFDSTGFADPQLYTTAHIHLGELCIKKKDYARALTVLDRTRGRCEQADDLPGLARCLYGLGTAHSKNGDDDKGIALFEDALGVLNSLKPSKDAALLRARINNQLGFIATKLKDYEKAQTHLETSVDLLREYDSEIVMGETYRLLGEMYCQRKQHIQSERALKKSYDIFERNAARYDSARCCKSLGENYLDAGNLTMSNFFFEESIHLLEDLGIESELPMVYSAKARISMMQQDYEAAEALFLKDYNLARKSDNVHSMAFSYYQLGKVRRLLKRSHSAEDYLRRSLELFDKIGNQIMAGQVKLEQALCVCKRFDIKKAEVLCKEAEGLFKKLKNEELQARAKLVLAIVQRDSRDNTKKASARNNFETAIEKFEKINKVSFELAETYYEFALYWRDRSDLKNAAHFFIQAIELCDKLGLSARANSYFDDLRRINPDEAHKFHLGRFVDTSAVDTLKNTSVKSGIRVDKKTLTVFFTDIRSFTTISETLSLEELTSFLNDFYAGVTQVIVKFHGQINKFIGDEVMAIFDEQPGLAPAPLRAVRAGDELTRVLNEINLRRRKRGEIDIGVGVGINTGAVIVGSFGSSMRQDYTAIGDTVNVAARLQGQAAAGEVVISDAVYQLVQNHVEAEDMGEKPLKGKGQPMRLWKVHGVQEETRELP